MAEEIQLKLVKEGDFLGTKCDFYMDDKQNVYMTREQIGEALQYKDGDGAIRTIHARNKDRLDKFSTRVTLPRVEGGRHIEREIVLYTEKGIYDICRFSRQPLADQFYDWVYDQIIILRKTGNVLNDKEKFLELYCSNMNEAQKTFVHAFMTEIEEKQKIINDMQPKVDNWQAYMDAKGNITMSKLAKTLNIKGLGRNNLLALLRDKQVLQQNNEPYQTYVSRGYFEVGQVNKNGFKFSQTLVTGKGMEWLNKKMNEWGYKVS